MRSHGRQPSDPAASPRSWRPQTVLVAAGRPADEPGQPLNVPIVLASNFRAGNAGETGGRQYSRGDGTPGWQALEDVLGDLEGGEAVAFASGMAAVAAVLDLMPAGACVVVPTDCYAGVGELLADGQGQVCGDENIHNVIDVLFALADKSLVGVETQTTGGARCFMLETVRTYMLERLVEREGEQVTRERHMAWFCDFCARCDYISHPDAHERWPSLEVNIDNVRAAIAWCLDVGDLSSFSVLAASLWSWSWLTGRVAETRVWIEAAITAATSQEPDLGTLARLKFAAGASRFNTGDYEQAEPVLREAWQKARELSDPNLSLAAEGLLGGTLPHLGRLDEAWQHIEHAYQECETTGLPWGAGYMASVLGSLSLLVRGDSTAAASLHERSLELAKDIGAVLLEAQAHTQLAYLDMSRADVPSAWRHLGIAADLYNRNPHQEGVSYCLDTMAILLFSSGDVAPAAELHITAEATRASLQMPVWPILRPLLDGFGEQLRNALGEEQFVLALEQSTAQNALDLLVTVAEAHRPEAGARVLGGIASRRRPAARQQRSSEDVP
jgi:tetratricopeptide (TPR) repeat protein